MFTSAQLGHGSNLDVHRQMKIKKLWYIYTKEYYSAIKRNEIGSYIKILKDLETIIWSEVRKTSIIYINAYMWNLKQWYR